MSRFATIASNVALVAFTGSFIGLAMPAEHAQAADACRQLTEGTCLADVGCKWKAAESWTRVADGKTKTTKARCAYDAKSARLIIQSALEAHHQKNSAP